MNTGFQVMQAWVQILILALTKYVNVGSPQSPDHNTWPKHRQVCVSLRALVSTRHVSALLPVTMTGLAHTSKAPQGYLG